MADLGIKVQKDIDGVPTSQLLDDTSGEFVTLKGKNNALFNYTKDGYDEAIGATTDTSSQNTVIGLLKAQREALISGSTVQTVLSDFEKEIHDGNAYHAEHKFHCHPSTRYDKQRWAQLPAMSDRILFPAARG